MMDFKKTIQQIDLATANFEKSVSGSERFIYSEMQKIIKDLGVDATGNIKPSVENLRLLTKMRKYVARLANNKGYLKAVKDLVNSFEDVYQSQMKYFATITQNVPHTKKYALMKQIAIDNTITNLTGAGLQASVTDKINDMLLRAVTSGAKYADLTKELHEHLTKTDKGSGALSKYANTYATTAISQYAGENNKILTDDLGLEWFEYVGSNIETTREFCEHLTEKRYIHKSEIKTILKGEIDGHQCEIYEKTGLPKGMIEGTTEQNFQVNCGGWNCRHQLVPVAKEAVPKEIRARFEKNLKEIKTQGIRNNNVIKKNIKSFYEEITPIIVNNENEIRLIKTHETAICFDSKGKILIDKRGESTSVNFAQSELGKMKDCVLTHNHPRGWGFSENSLGRIGNSFSPNDIYLAISANLSEIRAVTPTYTFSMKRPKTGWGISVNELNKVINEEHQKSLSNFNKIINNAPSWHKDVCAERASALHFHIVMKNLSKRLGFIYEKTKSV